MIAVNALSQMGALGVTLVLQTVYMIVVARVLGPEDFGRLSFAWAITQMMLIGGDLGLHNTAVRRISADRENSLEHSTIFFWLKTVLTGGLLAALVLVAVLIQEPAGTGLLLGVFGAGMFFHSFSLALNVVFQAHGKLYWASLNIVMIFFVQLLLGLGLLWAGGGLIALGLAYLIATVAALVVNVLIFKKEIHPIHLTRSEGWRPFVRESLAVGTSTLFHTVSGRLGVTLLPFLAGVFQTGIFAAAVRVTQSTANIPLGILSAVLPVMASHQKESAPVRRLFRKSLLWMVVISLPLALFFFLIASPLIGFLYGRQYNSSVSVLRILALAIVPMFVGMALSHVLLSQTHLLRRLPAITGIALAVHVISNLLLIPQLGSEGAAYAFLIHEVVLVIGYALAAAGFLSRPSG